MKKNQTGVYPILLVIIVLAIGVIVFSEGRQLSSGLVARTAVSSTPSGDRVAINCPDFRLGDSCFGSAKQQYASDACESAAVSNCNTNCDAIANVLYNRCRDACTALGCSFAVAPVAQWCGDHAIASSPDDEGYFYCVDQGFVSIDCDCIGEGHVIISNYDNKTVPTSTV